MNFRRGLLIVLLVGLGTLSGLTNAQEGAASVQGGDDAQLRAFIARYVGIVGSPTPISVTVGSLPQLPFAMPLPDGVTVVGAVTRFNNAGDASANTGYDLLLQGGAGPGQILDFYTQTLNGAGWATIQSDVGEPTGFTASSNAYGIFCLPDNSASMSINPYTPDGTLILTSITVITPADVYQCQTSETAPPPNAFELIPSLSLPSGVTVVNNMGGGLSYYLGQSASSSAILSTTLTLAEIAPVYVEQLTGKGWTPISSESGERFFISDWTLVDANGKTWRGTFILTKDATPDTVNALIYIQE
jgi:hypothetical protein